MPLTPDEIATRAFTPSADGYHQGEVREFLARVATERSALLASRPEGQAEAADVAVALGAHEQRLQDLERRLANTAADLAAIAEALRANQDRASQQLAAARKLTADQQAIVTNLAARPAATAPLPRPDYGAGRASNLAAESVQPPAHLPSNLTEPTRYPSTAATTPPAAATSTPPPPSRPAPTGLVRHESASSVPPRPDQSPGAASVPPVPSPAGVTGRDRVNPLDPDGPLIADNANELLDGVLDDVLGNLNERPPT